MKKPTFSVQAPQRQKGAILVFCLVFLAVLTMMGVAGMESTILEERMSGNMRDHSMAFQAAESSLAVAETWLQNQVNLPIVSDDGSTVVWEINAMDPDSADGTPWWEDAARLGAWWTANADVVAGFDAEGVVAAPLYVIEEFHTATTGQSIGIGSGETSVPRVFHRVTARAVGATTSAVVYVQSTFVKPYE
ncbi:MAG: PilX N-terminal domain-containing pilus assembly protein [Pseudohongiellaceae bacterium]